jgi:hypothetical protein
VLERMMAAVHRYEGLVNQVMGDGIMAVFGAPIAHEDHAVRAWYAALAMPEAIRRDSEEVRRGHGVGVPIHVGLHSGAVVVRSIGNDLHIDYSAIGPTTPLVARMKQLATPGSIRRQAHMRQNVSRLLGVHRNTISLWLTIDAAAAWRPYWRPISEEAKPFCWSRRCSPALSRPSAIPQASPPMRRRASGCGGPTEWRSSTRHSTRWYAGASTPSLKCHARVTQKTLK